MILRGENNTSFLHMKEVDNGQVTFQESLNDQKKGGLTKRF